MNISYEKCNMCGRFCSVNREKAQLGYCKMPSTPYISRIGLHKWEEPIISGTRGSGTVFFSGCSLGCVFCQNREISRAPCGIPMTDEKLAQRLVSLQEIGAHNINFVTPTHYAKSVIESVRIARERGLEIPIVYNTSSYDTKETIQALNGTVDIFLPDFKYYLSKTARQYSNSPNYVDVAKEAISEMVKIAPELRIENGIMVSGVIVRILLLPSHVAEAKLSLEYLYKTYGDSVYISLMSQYTPFDDLPPPLARRVTQTEYYDLVSYADKLGVKNAFTQDFSSAGEEYIPLFNQ